MTTALERVVDVALRVTMPLPLGIDHVHSYLVRGASGGLLLVDTGLGLPAAEDFWQKVQAEAGEEVTAILVTHSHPDHVGGAALVAAIFDAPLHQGRLDWEICLEAGSDDAPSRLAAHIARHGMPADIVVPTEREHVRLWRHVHWQGERQLLDAGDDIDGWCVLHLPGHADGHIALLRDDVLVCGDVLLDPITPHVSLAPPGRSPDPLGDYLSTLETVEDLAPGVALPGHYRVLDAPAERARAIRAHHARRLEAACHAATPGPVTAFEASLTLFPTNLTPTLRRFALLETLSHLEHLARHGRLARTEDGSSVRFGRI